VRVAANVIGPTVVGSLEFAVAELRTPLIVVLGHEGCAGVQAALGGQTPPGDFGELIRRVYTGADLPSGNGAAMMAAVRTNVSHQSAQLLRSETIRNCVADGRLRIVGGVYSLTDGEVDWVDP